MAPLSLKIVLDEGAVTRTLKFESSTTVAAAQAQVKEKILTGDDGKVYGLFLTSADDERSGVWLEGHRQLDYYMLRDGDQLHYLCRMRNLRVRLLDGSVRTLQVDESKTVEELMVDICARLGITNHDEYGLCHDRETEQDENKLPAGTGTLTLKRVAQKKERDAKLEQLSKKIKTDDNVEWLEQKSTLRELGAGDAPLLLKRRLFYSDRNVDARDPVQLNLLYVQARDAILEGRHPVTEDQAVEFAGIQCQVHYGDFQEDKHKPGLIENLNEYLPEQYSGSWGAEKKILKEYRKHSGLSPIEAKYLYTKTARDLPTYGVTFFLVKEKQKGKKKLVPRLLGINAESILRLDEVTKEILQVWPLTQFKTYHAGKSETFTLNFRDYSDKEYSVKTNDAHRIRDILQGYIDLIRRRMEAKWQAESAVHHAVGEEYVEAGRGHLMEHIQHNSKALVEETFVGPSKIISYEPGQVITQGTQIMTVQQVVVTDKGSNRQNIVVGQVPMRRDMSLDFVRKLNKLNSNSVKIVSFLAEPSESNIEEARKLVKTMEADMPSIIDGVHESAKKQPTEEARMKLLDELQELCDCMKALSEATSGDLNSEKAEDAAMRIADLSTQMYFSLDPRTLKRGELCRRSRNSFIQDDKMDATLRRASFIAAAQIACGTIDHARAALEQNYEGPILDASAVEELEKAAEAKMGKLNAAVALYLTAYADPKNVDYSAAVTSMNTINELLPELTKDAMMLSGVKDGNSRQDLLDEIKALCDAAKRVCLITDPDDHEKIQEAAYEYGRVSEKLMFTFRRKSPQRTSELVDLAKEIGRKTSFLVAGARDLAAMAASEPAAAGVDEAGTRCADAAKDLLACATDIGRKTSFLVAGARDLAAMAASEPAAAGVDEAGTRCADAAKDLLACATVTSPSIHEPHCQSALTAAAETLSSAAQHLAAAWKPLVEDPSRKQIGDDLKDKTLDLAKALDRLKNAFANLNGAASDDSDDDPIRKGQRLQFITTVADAKNRLAEAEDELKKALSEAPLDKASASELQRKLAQRVAQLNAALAALVAATSDREKPDYTTADLAVTTITELMPDIVKDGKALSATMDEKSREDMMRELKALCDASRGVCEASEHGGTEALNNSASKFAKTSGKLFYVFNPRANQNKDNEIMGASSAAFVQASAMLAKVQQLASDVGGESGAELDRAGTKVADAANTLLTSAQLTAPCIEDPRCQAGLLSSANSLSSVAQQLASTWTPLLQDPHHQDLRKKLEGDRQQLEKELERLRNACQVAASGDGPSGRKSASPDKQRLQFITTAAAAKKQVEAAEKELNKPAIAPKGPTATADLKHRLYDSAARLNAAVAALVAAAADRENPDYVAADNAMNTINQLLPQVVKDTKSVTSGEDDKTREEILRELRALCDAARGICESAGAASNEDLNRSAAKLACATGKLVYVFNPRASQDKEHEILDVSSSACEKASQLLNDVYQLAAEADGEAGSQLDGAGSKLADAANALLTTAQLTAPCMQDPRCQASLVASANAVSAANQHLASTWLPVIQDQKYKALGEKIQKGRSELEDELERLKRACRVGDSGNEVQVKGVTRPALTKDPKHLKFVSTAAEAESVLQKAEKELDKPIVAAKGGQMPADLQNRLAQSLAQLNAAIAALLTATADREKPDYETAEQSIQAINQLMPQVVKDTKALSASKDEKERQALLDELRSMCEATRGICFSARDGNHEDLNSSAAKLASASGKLVFQFNPRASQDKEREIINVSSSACEKASQLLNDVYQLAAEVDGETVAQLDGAGSKLADAANALLTTAQLTAPCMEDPRCQASLVASANAVSAANQHLASTWLPVIQDQKYQALGEKIQKGRTDLDDELERLKKACRVGDSGNEVQVKGVTRPALTKDPKHLKFVSTAAEAESVLQKAEKEIDKPIVAAKGGQMPADLQNRLAQSLAQLNAAIAALLTATADREKPDYETAEQSIQAINQLMPQVVKDTKALSASKDEKERQALLDELRSMCEATRGICSSARDGNHEDLNSSAAKLANASGKLVFQFNPRASQDKEREIINVSSSACGKASQLLNDVYQLAAAVDGEAGAQLDGAGSKLADAANALLTTAQLTAPCMEDPRCQASLVASANAMSAANQQLASTWLPVIQDQKYQALGEKIQKGRSELEDELERLMKACHVGDNGNEIQVKNVSRPAPTQGPKHLKFVSAAEKAEGALQKAEMELDKPIVPTRGGQIPADLQSKLAQSLAQLNAAIAALLAATADREKPDYETAEKSIQAINQLMPQVVKDTKALSAGKDDKDRQAMLDELRNMCEATRGICTSARDGNHENMNYNAVRFGNNSGKLFYVISPQTNQDKEHQIIDLSSQACEKATMLLTEVYQLAAEVGGDTGAELDSCGSNTADAAKTLLATAQLTAPSIHEPRCQAAMLSAADALSSSAQRLAHAWAAPAQLPAQKERAAQLENERRELEDAVEKIRAAVSDDAAAVKSPTRRAPPPPPKRASTSEPRRSMAATRDFNQEFLHQLRCEESQNVVVDDDVAIANKRKTDDEKALLQQFGKSVDAAALKIKKAEEDVNKIYSAKDDVVPALSVDQTLVVQKQMEQKLSQAAVAAANLVASNHPDSIDLVVASKSTATLSELMPHIVQDAKLLRGSLNDEERKRFVADIVALFEATKNMLEAAKEDRKKLDKSAVEFGNKSAKLLYVVSTDVDPGQEKEVLERVRDINENASRLAVLGAESASDLPAPQLQALCRAGARAAGAATTLAYTAKLVAPSIQNAECNEALTNAANDLSTHLQTYSSTWAPLEVSPQSSSITELRTEASSLERLLEELRRDLGTGKLVKRRTVERVVIEDTPLRRLACVVQEEAKKRAESTNTLPELRAKYAKYANELGQAVKQLDLAYHRCRQAPQDLEKRQELEYAVQNLQITLLQTRPSLDGTQQSNIVDLTEYVKEVSNDADKLIKECEKGPPELTNILGSIQERCSQIVSRAARLTTADSYDQGEEAGWMEIEQFAEECDQHLNGINYMLESLNDGKLKIDLQEKATRLSEDCNMLRFATKCALASSQGVSLDATLDDLTDLEGKIDEMLAEGDSSHVMPSWSSDYGRGRLVAATARAGAGIAHDLPPAFTSYMDDVRTRTDLSNEPERNQSKEHLRKVLGLLKALTMTTSRHVATWQPLGQPEAAAVTGQILQELDSHHSRVSATKGKPPSSALADLDMNQLLYPPTIKVEGDQKQISDKLQQAASKLSTATSTIMQSAHKPESLSRSAHAAAAAAAGLAAHARALRTNDVSQTQKIDEATKEMSLQTYNVLKTADMLSQEPNNIARRMKLLDACRQLNDAINQLVRTTTQSSRMHRECGALTRSLQLQQALLAAPLPAAALRYGDAMAALQNQRDVIQKLSNDEPVSREEFARTLSYVSSAVCNSTEYAAQCAYLLAIADQNKDVATDGFIDASRIRSLSEAVQDTCHRMIRTDVEQAKAEELVLSKQTQDLQQAVSEARDRSREGPLKDRLAHAGASIDSAAKALHAVVNEKTPDRAKLTSYTIRLLDCVKAVDGVVESASLAPEVKNISADAKARSDEVLKNTRTLNNNMVSLVREVRAGEDDDPMTWVTFGTSRKAVLDAFEALFNSVKENGKRAGVLESSQSDDEEADQPKKSYVQIQLDLANKWLARPTVKPDVKTAGEEASKNIIKIGEQLAEDLKDNEREEMLQLTQDSKALLTDCSKKYDNQKARALMERLKELKKSIERGVVTRIVEDFLEGHEPLADLDILAEIEKDETKRKFLLERKIAELLAHLARVSKTARIAAGAGSGGPQRAEDLIQCSDQTELLAPMLVKAAQQRVMSPDDKAAIEHYQKLLAEYAESLANMRNLCDQAVDPMDFVQTAGETMQRLREDTAQEDDPQKCAYASTAITKLANRVINVSMSSNDVRKDPELQKLLKEAKEKLKATVPSPNARASRIPDWKVTTAEILRTTGEVESVLGGEMIFNKQQGADQPIFAAARDLHSAVRGWSARDNDIVAVAKRMAVLMAKLSDYMNTDRKREVLSTSKAIVMESHEVAELARKLANECTDVRIKTNLLQVCERIPTISGQLKMLATVKGSSLGHQDLKEDQEDMIMLVGNAQNLMLSVQEVVKAAASASVKIESQRGGPRMRWVRKNYY